MRAAREAWFEAQPDLDPARLVFVDETWTATKHGSYPRSLAARRAAALPCATRACVDAPAGASKISGAALRVIGCCHVSGL